MTTSIPEKLKPIACDEEKTLDTSPKLLEHKNSFVAGLISLLYIFAMGMTISYPASATVDMRKPGSRLRGITDDDISWIGSLTLLGGIPANVLGGYFTHVFGRKAVLMIFSPLFLSGWLMITYAPTIAWLCAGRIISGFCTGLFVVACPAYMTEIAPKEIRGLLSSGFPLANNFGIFVVMFLGISLRWSWLAMSIAILITFSSCLMLFMPESPAWLIKESRVGEAASALKFLRGRNVDVKEEIHIILKGISEQHDTGVSFKELRNPIFYKPLAISICLMLFHTTSGSGPIITYTVEIFQEAGSIVDPEVSATVLAGVQILAVVFCGSIIDKYGRRKLYIISGIGTCLTLCCLGGCSLAIKQNTVHQQVLGYAPLIVLIVYSFVFSFGVGNIPFIMAPELVPIRFRSALLSLSTFCLSIFGFIVTKSFHSAKELVGDYGVYWIFSFLTFLSILFGYFILPETKNLSTDEISKTFAKKENNS